MGRVSESSPTAAQGAVHGMKENRIGGLEEFVVDV
jgi:hypothetical protein